jgi:integrase
VINKNVRRTKIFDSKESYHYEIRVTRPKSETSNRKIPLPSALKTELKKLNILVKEEKLKMGSAYTDNGLLFPSLTGNYIDASTLMKSWKRALKRAEIPYRTFHALRHTYATLLLEKNAPLIEVSRLLGHSTVKTTEIYAHPSLEAKKKTVEKLDEIIM